MTVMPLSFALIIVGLGIFEVSLSVLMQRKLVNPKRMRELQARLKSISKEMNALIKSNAPKEQISAKQSEIMPLMKENMTMSFKPMIVIFPIFIIVYYVLLPALAGKADYILNFIGIPLTYNLVFIATVFILGLISSIAILLYDRKKAKEEAKENKT
ncbi:EMC3/TMCO1 family protein [Candidatus Marsarchaeota archaeon]|jgi:uncharacterized membrane protein (DUF106 family)|nr:EMC3/TMCO1 family protein [Candidatus Marsarchaeota archaeon]MCL5092314.1 EMC3/TMCO1 family protein [Candidatus Marsarchaeota archaeon]